MTGEERPDIEARARGIHGRILTLDTHVDIEAAHFAAEGPNYLTTLEATHVDLPRMEAGGLDAVFFAVYQAQEDDFTDAGYRRAYEAAVAKVEAIERLTRELAPERIELARTADDVRRIAASGKLVALLGMENGYALGQDAGRLAQLAARGVRSLSLTHNGHNQLADSHTGDATSEHRWGGLSPLGREVVAEANRLGVVLDLSHPSKAANLETIELSRAPVMASHSAARALADRTRNLDDEQLLAIRDSGGVVHVVALSGFLVAPPAEGPGTRATVGDLADHIDYIVDLIGIDHVGVASDFDGGGGIVGWEDASETFGVTLELVRRGYTEEDIAKIWSGNALRVLEAAERAAG